MLNNKENNGRHSRSILKNFTPVEQFYNNDGKEKRKDYFILVVNADMLNCL